MANAFNFIGYLKPVKNSEDRKGFMVTNYDSGWMSERLRFIVVAGDNRHFVEINAGRWKEENKNTIYGFTKGENGAKGEPVQIPWAKRNSPDVIEKMVGWKVFTVDTETFSHRKELEESGDTEALEVANKKRRHFLAATEFCEFVNKLVNSDKAKDMKFCVKGVINYTYSEKNDRYYSTYEVNKIYRVDDDTPVSSEVNVDFFFTEGAMDSSDYAETGKAVVSGYTQFYDSTTKKFWFCPMGLALRCGADEAGLKKIKGYDKIFSKFEDDVVRKISLTCQAIDGAPKVDVTYDDLSDEVKENVDFGLISLEDAIRDAGGSMYGDKIQEIRIEKLGRGSSKGSETTVYTVEDINRKPFKEEEKVEEIEDIFSDDDDEL